MKLREAGCSGELGVGKLDFFLGCVCLFFIVFGFVWRGMLHKIFFSSPRFLGPLLGTACLLLPHAEIFPYN